MKWNIEGLFEFSSVTNAADCTTHTWIQELSSSSHECILNIYRLIQQQKL